MSNTRVSWTFCASVCPNGSRRTDFNPFSSMQWTEEDGLKSVLRNIVAIGPQQE